MSLLLDALKRAEQEKLARQPSSAASPAPAARTTPPPSGLELQPMSAAAGAQATHASKPEVVASNAPPSQGAQAAKNVFQAKGEAANESSRSRGMLWVTVGAVAIVAIAAAGYVWYTVKSLTPQYANSPRPRAAPTPPPASSAPLPPTSAMGSIVPAPGSQPATTETSPAVAPPGPSPASAASAAAPPAAVPKEPAETSAERLARAGAAARTPPPLQMERTPQAAPRVPAEVSNGYDALRKGDWGTARRAYQAAAASDPTNVDAQLGLATIAAREGNRVAAVEHYRRTLELDPRNGTALAGLAALADFSRPEALEAQLRADLDRSPASPELHFTLGNVFAGQGRWTEAQAEYYEAHRLDPGSPEVAHNLAVSLDRLGQRRLAAAFYRRALDGARARSSALDTAAVARRLAEIE